MESNFKNPNIEAFLKRNHIAVLATADKQTAQPHAATIYYMTDSQMNIYFLTKDGTMKSKNIEGNPYASIAIYEAETQTTAQISGPINKVEDSAMMEKAMSLASKYSKETSGTDETPISKLYAGNYVLYRLWPQFIRLGEYKFGPRGQIFDTATPAEESLE